MGKMILSRMHLYKHLWVLALAICALAPGCGKVTQQVGSKLPPVKNYATLKMTVDLQVYKTIVVQAPNLGSGKAPTTALTVAWSDISTRDPNLYVSVYGVRHKGKLEPLAWGQGNRPSWATLDDPVLSYSLSRKGKKIKQPEAGTPFIQYVPGDPAHWEVEVSHLTQPYPYLLLAVSAGHNRPLLLTAIDGSAITADALLTAATPTYYETWIAALLRLAQARTEVSRTLAAISPDQLRMFYSIDLWRPLEVTYNLTTLSLDEPLQDDALTQHFAVDGKPKTKFEPLESYLNAFELRTEALSVYKSAVDDLKLPAAVYNQILGKHAPAPIPLPELTSTRNTSNTANSGAAPNAWK